MTRPRLPRLLDAGLAVLLVALGLAEVLVPLGSRQGTGSTAASLVGVIGLGGTLAWRRRQPLAIAAVVLLGWPVLYVVDRPYVLFWGTFVPMAVATYSVPRWGTGRTPYVGAGLALVTLVAGNVVVPELRGGSEVVFDAVVAALAWSAGFGLALYQQQAAVHLRRAIDAEVTAAEQTMAALLEERTRIARELHDIVAHAVSTIVVQAGAAEQAVDGDPEYARQALAAIRRHGSGALDEMRRVLVMLRAAEGELRPQPGVDALDDLVAQSRQAGLDVVLAVRGQPRELPAGLGLAAYRIVQEALTNARRHAGAAAVSVVVTYAPGELRLAVSDDGRGVPQVVGGPGSPATPPSGHGLVGMRERAAMYGGRVEAGPAPTGGFAVLAVLPLAT